MATVAMVDSRSKPKIELQIFLEFDDFLDQLTKYQPQYSPDTRERTG